MVANGYDGLRRWMERGIGSQAPSDPNGVDVYQHLSHDMGWWEQGRLIGKAHGGRAHEAIRKSRIERFDVSLRRESTHRGWNKGYESRSEPVGEVPSCFNEFGLGIRRAVRRPNGSVA